MKFCICDLFLMTVIVASMAGCKSKPAPGSSVAPAAKVPAVPQQITKERAIEIVRQDMAAKNPPEVQCDYKATEKEQEYRVHVEMGSGRDENGRLTGQYVGSHCTYILSKQGKIIVIHEGL
jgi:hypothetical protein